MGGKILVHRGGRTIKLRNSFHTSLISSARREEKKCLKGGSREKTSIKKNKIRFDAGRQTRLLSVFIEERGEIARENPPSRGKNAQSRKRKRKEKYAVPAKRGKCRTLTAGGKTRYERRPREKNARVGKTRKQQVKDKWAGEGWRWPS